MAWLDRWREAGAAWLAEGLDALVPPHCPICGVDMAGGGSGRPRGSAVCPACVAAVSSAEARCPLCGMPCDGVACRGCRAARRRWDGIVVLGPYADDLRTAVLRAKRPAGERVAAALATLLVHRHRDTLAAWAPDVVVPVPMHWLRRVARGTSAADVLARGVAATLRRPCRQLLQRHRATTMQNRLPTAERRGNVLGAFRPRGRLVGRRILLVDDVTTTGATLEACGAAAISAGAAAVYAAVVARADAGTVPSD